MNDETPDLPDIFDIAGLTPDRARWWLALDGWTIDEAAHLLHGVAPFPHLLAAWARVPLFELNARVEYEAFHNNNRFRLQRAGETGALTFPAAPSAVIRWAMNQKRRLPELLIPAGAVVRGGQWVMPPALEQEPSAQAAHAPETPPAPASEPAAVVPTRGRHMKRNALIDANRPRWDTIERDLKDGAENGLSAAAKGNKHAFWWEGSALKWAEENGKLQAPAGLALSGTVHRLRG